MKTCPAILAILVLAPALFARQAAPAQQALPANSNAFVLALLHKDVAGLNTLLTDNATAVWSDGKLNDRADLLDIAAQGGIQEYTPHNIKILPVDNNTTLVTYDCIIHMPEGDTGLAPRYQHVSELWVKQGNTHKLRFLQFTADRPVD
jgi:Domain of unknown function (DUF4440)